MRMTPPSGILGLGTAGSVKIAQRRHGELHTPRLVLDGSWDRRVSLNFFPHLVLWYKVAQKENLEGSWTTFLDLMAHVSPHISFRVLVDVPFFIQMILVLVFSVHASASFRFGVIAVLHPLFVKVVMLSHMSHHPLQIPFLEDVEIDDCRLVALPLARPHGGMDGRAGPRQVMSDLNVYSAVAIGVAEERRKVIGSRVSGARRPF
jgi:hypothetical protein